ncbi:DUF4113 domain-containing protein [Cronobacter dublinensis]
MLSILRYERPLLAQSRCYYTIQMPLISARSGTTRHLDAAWCDGHQNQETGVVLGKFISQRMAQLNLFDEDAPRPNSLMKNELNQQGLTTLYFARQGIQRAWQMKHEMLSPCYTTRHDTAG